MEEKKSNTEKSTKNQKTEIVAADKVERAAKLTEKLKELVEIAKKKKNMLEYQEIADFTNGKDFTTCDIAKHILAEEEEHEQDLQDYLTDIARMKKSFLDK